MTSADGHSLLGLIEAFIDGSNRGREGADEIAGIVIECCKAEPWYDDAVMALSLYDPGLGSPYLSEEDMVRALEPVAQSLRAFLSKQNP